MYGARQGLGLGENVELSETPGHRLALFETVCQVRRNPPKMAVFRGENHTFGPWMATTRIIFPAPPVSGAPAGEPARTRTKWDGATTRACDNALV